MEEGQGAVIKEEQGVGIEGATAGSILLPPNCFKYQLLPVKGRGGDCKDVDQELVLEEVRHQRDMQGDHR